MPAVSATRYLVQAGWDHVPHLSEKAKADLRASTLPHLLDARSKGIPSIGAGAIYPIDLESILVDAFPIPGYYRRAYGLDVGWNRTAALWGAIDDSDVMYLYSEHYMARAAPPTHALSIQSRGKWIPGVIDPASRQSSQKDGDKLIRVYRQPPCSLNLTKADNAVQAGLEEVWTRIITGRLKIFRSLMNLQTEFKLYRRDENGKIVKKNDHLMDCLRYLCISGVKVARTEKLASDGKTTHVASSRAGY